MESRNRKLAIYLPVLFSLILVTGLYLGKYLKREIPVNDKLSAVISYIEDEYVDSVSRELITEQAIPDILNKLDPHSIYIPARNLERVNEPLRGNFDGIGVRFNMQNDTILIIQVIKGGPSDKAGLEAGDRIVKVNDTIVAGVNFNEDKIVSRLKGKGGSRVKVSINRKGIDDLIDFDITRGKIPLYSIDVSYMIDEEIGYVKINTFSRTTYKEFKDAIKKLKMQGLKKLVMDLRANVGGYMEMATLIADEFLEKGKLIVYTEGKARPRTDVFASSKQSGKDLDLVVLIDEGSASASEVLAGAIQDNDRGTIMGRRSYGKGLVQEQTMFNDGSAMRLTIARYYTPTGRSIQRPYENGTEDYMRDFGNRYMNGELMEEDSIQFHDSLKFITPEGRVLYGGGGIMPDIFIAYDTTGITRYFSVINRLGYIYNFSLKYSDENRVKLSSFNNYKDMEQYLDNQKVFDQLINFVTDKGVKENHTEINQSRLFIESYLKAYILRNYFDNDGFYPIIRKVDNTLQKAIAHLK